MKDFQGNILRTFLDYCSSLISVTVVKHSNKKKLEGRKEFILFILADHIPPLRSQGRNSRKELEAEPMGKYRLLPSLCSVSFLIKPRATDLGITQPLMRWDLPINHQSRQSITYMVTSQTGLGNSLVVVPSSQVALGWVKSTTITHQDNY